MLFSDDEFEESVGVFYQRWSKLADHMLADPELNMYLYVEAYSAAGETGFGWWLVEHYFSYHIDCPDGCDSGESTRGG